MRAGVGHIGSALSVADIIAALYADVLDARTTRTTPTVTGLSSRRATRAWLSMRPSTYAAG